MAGMGSAGVRQPGARQHVTRCHRLYLSGAQVPTTVWNHLCWPRGTGGHLSGHILRRGKVQIHSGAYRADRGGDGMVTNLYGWNRAGWGSSANHMSACGAVIISSPCTPALSTKSWVCSTKEMSVSYQQENLSHKQSRQTQVAAAGMVVGGDGMTRSGGLADI